MGINMVKYGIETNWKINIKVGDYIEFYTGTIIEEDDYSIKIRTIKSELRVISKQDIVSAKEYVRADDANSKATY